MQFVTLAGPDPLRLSRVVHGAMAPRVGVGPEAQRASLAAALEAGVTSIDTAPLYGFGTSERLVGEAIAGRREELQVLTKVGLRWDGDHGRVLLRVPGPDGRERVVRCDSRPESVRRDVEESLERLGTDVLDLVQIHHPDEDTPLEDTCGELLRLKDEGKLRAIGASNLSPQQVERVRTALAPTPLASLQLRHNLIDRSARGQLLPLARDAGYGVLAYSPLARGWLGGGRRPGLAESRLRRALALLRATAAAHGASPAQVALAWTLAQPGLSAVLAGASAPAQAADSARAADLQLTTDERRALEQAFEGVVLRERAGPLQRVAQKARRVAGRAKRALLR